MAGRKKLPPGEKLTNAEKCRRYKEKMKNADPDKFVMKAREANMKCRVNRSMEKKLLIRQQNSEHKRQKRAGMYILQVGRFFSLTGVQFFPSQFFSSRALSPF